MKVIFLEDVLDVARAGEIKEVADGYGRNFLIPKKLAVLATPSAISTIEAQQRLRVQNQRQTEAEMTELAQQLSDEPIAAIVYTDIAKDGMMAGPNVPAMEAMQRVVDCPVIASGGVTTLDDVRRLAEAGMSGCIIGRALYEGKIHLDEVLAIARSQ